jgi:hypothetical protein
MIFQHTAIGVNVALYIYIYIYIYVISLLASDENVNRTMQKFWQALASIEGWCSKWKIKIDEEKTSYYILKETKIPMLLYPPTWT